MTLAPLLLLLALATILAHASPFSDSTPTHDLARLWSSPDGLHDSLLRQGAVPLAKDLQAGDDPSAAMIFDLGALLGNSDATGDLVAAVRGRLEREWRARPAHELLCFTDGAFPRRLIVPAQHSGDDDGRRDLPVAVPRRIGSTEMADCLSLENATLSQLGLPQPSTSIAVAGCHSTSQARAALPELAAVDRAVERFLGLAPEQLSGHAFFTQLLHYPPGSSYGLHTDCSHSRVEDRFFTLLVYLNDVASGGETRFPRVEGLDGGPLLIRPTAGRAILFRHLSPSNPGKRRAGDGHKRKRRRRRREKRAKTRRTISSNDELVGDDEDDDGTGPQWRCDARSQHESVAANQSKFVLQRFYFRSRLTKVFAETDDALDHGFGLQDFLHHDHRGATAGAAGTAGTAGAAGTAAATIDGSGGGRHKGQPTKKRHRRKRRGRLSSKHEPVTSSNQSYLVKRDQDDETLVVCDGSLTCRRYLTTAARRASNRLGRAAMATLQLTAAQQQPQQVRRARQCRQGDEGEEQEKNDDDDDDDDDDDEELTKKSSTQQALAQMEASVAADPTNAAAWKLLAMTQLSLLLQLAPPHDPRLDSRAGLVRKRVVRTLRQALHVFPADVQMRQALVNLTAQH